jgi:phosphatidylinositol-bisphosphatase
LLLPDERTTVQLTIDIDGEMAGELNQFRPRLEVTLILHVGLGKDHFVPVSAAYGALFRPVLPSRGSRGFSIGRLEPTCFANTLLYLTRLRGPIRDVKAAGDLLPEDDAKNAPREVMRVVNHMMMSGGGDAVSAHAHFPKFG